MCNANCINTGDIGKNTCGRNFLCDFIFVKLSNYKKYFDHKKWNYGIVFVYVVCAVPQYASACNRHKQFSALKLFWYMDTHVCVL